MVQCLGFLTCTQMLSTYAAAYQARPVQTPYESPFKDGSRRTCCQHMQLHICIRPGLYTHHKSLHSKVAPGEQSHDAQGSWICQLCDQPNAQPSYIPMPPYLMQKARLICDIVDSSCFFIKNAKVNMCCLYHWNIVWKTTYSSPVAFRTKLKIDSGRLCGLVLFISNTLW